MVDKTDIIEIKIPDDMPSEIKKSDSISNTRKVQIAQMVNEGKAKIQKTEKKSEWMNDIDKKLSIVMEILEDRSETNSVLFIDEIKDMAKLNDSTIGPFMQKLNKFARDNNINLKKAKKNNKTCYSV